ncbi:MAG: M28 family metallopeptidase [Anaerolineae bacterium]
MPPKANTAREERVLRTVRDIIERFGPRLPGSEAERSTAQYLRDRFLKLGLDVELQPVALTTQQHLPLILAYGLVVLAAIIMARSPAIAAPIAVAGLAAILTEANGTPTISRLLPKRQSYNVIAKIPGDSPARRYIIVVAHLDSARATMFSHPRAALIQRQSFMLALNTAAIIAVLAVLGSLAPLARVWWVAFAAGLYLIFHITVLVHGSLHLPPSPGANDNASGLAVLVELPECLRSLKATEVWLVATCGHEVGLAGMRAFLNQNLPSRDSTGVINLESVGAGGLCLTLSEGYLRRTPVSRRLLEVAAEVVHTARLPVQARHYQNEPTEASLALSAGIPAISLVGFDRRGAVPNWHWHSDTVDNLEPATIAVAAKLVEGMVSRLDVSIKTTLPPGS